MWNYTTNKWSYLTQKVRWVFCFFSATCRHLRKPNVIPVGIFSSIIPELRPLACPTWWWGAASTNFQDNGGKLQPGASTRVPFHPQKTRWSFCCPWFPLVSCTAEDDPKEKLIKKYVVTNKQIVSLTVKMWDVESRTSTLVTTAASPFLSTSFIWKWIMIIFFSLQN